MLDYEKKYIEQGLTVAGIDEVGLGSFSGPMLACAIILDFSKASTIVTPARTNCKQSKPKYIDDSKRLSPERREMFFLEIPKASLAIGYGWVTVEEIEKYKNLELSGAAARRRALAALQSAWKKPIDIVLIDGILGIPGAKCSRQECIPQGDGKALCIAAASIMAKVTRDHHMTELAAKFPGYSWEKNKGYGTPDHLSAIRKLGMNEHHRKHIIKI